MFLLLLIPLSVPVFLILPKQGTLRLAADISPAAARTVGAFYAFFFLFASLITTAKTVLFAETVLFENGSDVFLSLLLLVSAAFGAVKGFEAIGRTAGILLFVIGVPLVLTALSALGDFHAENLTPPFFSGVKDVSAAALISAARTFEIAAAGCCTPFVNGKTSRSLAGAVGGFSAFSLFLLLITGGTAGAFAEDRVFPLYTLAGIVRFGFFERLEPAVTGLWILGAFIKNAFFIRLAVHSAEEGFSFHAKKPLFFVFTAITFAVSTVFPRTSANVSALTSGAFFIGLFLTGTVFIPLFLLCAERIKHGKDVATSKN